MSFWKSDSKLHLNLCLPVFALSQIPQFTVPVDFCRILKYASFPPSLSIKRIYASWLGVRSEEHFIFFLIALFAFNFLNFMVYMDVCVGVYLYTRVGGGFLHCMCWFHGRMIPTSCGSDWPGLVFVNVLFFWRIEWYLENQLLLSARMREQAAALENAGKLYHMF